MGFQITMNIKAAMTIKLMLILLWVNDFLTILLEDAGHNVFQKALNISFWKAKMEIGVIVSMPSLQTV